MKSINTIGAQGDVVFQRVNEIPADARKVEQGESYVVAHSETGHHHVARPMPKASLEHFTTNNPLEDFLTLRGGDAIVEHQRSYDTHETVKLLSKIDNAVTHYRVLRQRQSTPHGWSRVID